MTRSDHGPRGHRCSPGLVRTLAVWTGLVLLGVTSIGLVGSATAVEPGLGTPGQSGTSHAASPSNGPVSLLGPGDSRAARPNGSSGTNVFSPISRPPVILLVWSGVVALTLLGLLRAKAFYVDDGRADDTDREPWRSSSDADRVVELLVANDGFMKQSAIVEETDWSKAKVSRLLSRMADHGTIRKDKDGRENVIILREE